MSFEFTVLPDERFIEILEAWVDSPWPKTAEEGYALRDHFGWKPDSKDPTPFTSDVEPDEPSAYFTESNDSINSLTFPVTDIAPEEARVDSLEDALVIYRHFCDILTSRYGKPKQRRNKGVTIVRRMLLPAVLASVLVAIGHSLTATLSLLRRCLSPASMRVLLPRGTSRRTSSRG